MHIVQCLTQSNLGGAQVAVYSLVRLLRRWYPDTEVSVVLPGGGIFVERFKALGISVYEFPFNRIQLAQLSSIGSLLSRLSPDVIHSHGKGAGFYARSVSRRTSHAKRFHSYHGFHPPMSLGVRYLYNTLEAYLLRNTDKVVAVSPSEAEEVRREFSIAADKVEVVPNVVDPHQIRQDAKAVLSRELKAFFQKNRKSHIVTMVARNDAVKDYRLALGSAKRVMAKDRSTSFVFIGLPASDEGFQQLHKLFPLRVFALNECDKPASVMKSSHVVYLTSKKEGGLPLVLQEAFCLAKPVVATNVVGNRDLVQHRINGMLCDQTEDSVSNSILELVKDRALYKKLSHGAGRYSLSLRPRLWVERYFQLYSGQI